MGYLLIGVQLWLFCLLFTEAYYDAIGGVTAMSLAIVLANLLLGPFCPRTDKTRYLAFALSLIIFGLTMLFTPI